MKGILVDAGNDPAWGKLSAQGITSVYLAVNDPKLITQQRLGETRQRNLAAGVFAAWNWPGLDVEDGPAFAEWVHKLVKDLVPNATASFPKVQLDNEIHDPDVILAMLRRWRQLRPNTDTSWTFESHQAGWMAPDFVAEVVALKVRIVPQLYRGQMAHIDLRVSDPAAFLRELQASIIDSRDEVRSLVKAGFPDSLISPFFDAAFLPLGWDGFGFTQGRLPA
jgi:hypothetical protein